MSNICFSRITLFQKYNPGEKTVFTYSAEKKNQTRKRLWY